MELTDDPGIRFAVTFQSRPATFAEVIQAWQQDIGFRSQFNSWLADTPYAAFRWETPPVTADTLNQPFEFVVIDDPELSRSVDPETFAEHFNGATSEVVTFPNLGRNATLIVPVPIAAPLIYGHLADFVRHAPESQRHALWQSVGTAMTERVSVKPVWLSTAGAGVSWLHVRLDDRPKYYRFRDYRDWR